MNKSYAIWLKLGVVLGGLYLASQVTPIFFPIILAVVLSFILNPMVNYIEHLRLWPAARTMPRSLATALAIVFGLVTTAAIISFIFMPFIAEFNRFFANLPDLIFRIQNITGVLEQRANSLEIPPNIRAMIDQTLTSVASYALTLGQRVLNSTVGFASQVVELVVVPVMTFYFLKDWRELKGSALEILPPGSRAKGGVIIQEMASVVSGYIRGQAVISVIMGFIVFVGMYLLDVDYPLVLGLLAALTETIPIVGPIIGATPALFLAYLDSPALAAKVLIFFLVIHQLENHIIVPKIMGHTIDLHPVAVIISLLVGGQLLGVVGMILAVPVAALLKVLLRHLWRYE